jgi:ABC-type protease/lipase transport system fused ATPase/permease subunit
MTKEERDAYRKSVRKSRIQSVEQLANESRTKVDQQIANFMTMLTMLEGEWQRQEEARFQKEQELNEVKEHLSKVRGGGEDTNVRDSACTDLLATRSVSKW